MNTSKMTIEALEAYEHELECALAKVPKDSEEYEEMNKKLKSIKEILDADIIERDDNGYIVGHGSHRDYDYYSMEVQNRQGYYDNDGHFHRYEYNPED